MKALTAMRLTKEDNTPDAILSRLSDPADHEIPFIAAPPKNGEIHPELQAKVDMARVGEPCIFQGSVGAAYNE